MSEAQTQERTKEKKKQAASPAQKRKWYQKMHRFTRLGVQILFFILFPSAYSAGFAGVKYIFTQIGSHEMVQMTPFVALLLVLCLYTFVFGRFFCGYACAFGSLGDWIFGLHKTFSGMRTKRPMQIPDRVMGGLSLVKYGVLILIILLCVLQYFGNTAGMSPWDAFSQIRAGQFGSLPSYVIGLILLGLILIGMWFSERFFCRVLCPMGAVFSLLPVLPYLSVRRNREACIKGCSGCSKVCPAHIELPDASSVETPGDCFQCHKCTGVCPRGNVSCLDGRLHGGEFWLTLIRAGILALLLWKLGA